MSTISQIPPPASSASEETGADRVKIGDRVTLYKTANSPHWYIQYNLNGKQFRTSLKTHSKKRATELAKKKDAQLVLGQADPPAARPITIADAKAKYLQSLAMRGRDPKTLRGYRSNLDAFDNFCQQQAIRTLSQVTATVLETYQAQLEKCGVSSTDDRPKRKRGRDFKASANKPRTVRNKLKMVRQLLKWARKRGLLMVDPAVGYDLPPTVKGQAYCWSAAEVALILAKAPAEVRDLFDFLRLTGLRVDELCALTKEDWATDPPHLRIRVKVIALTGETWKPKHGHERIVPLCPQAMEIAARAAAASPGPWLFFAPDTQGKKTGRWRPGRIWKILKTIMKSAGVARGTTHTFRHVFCSFLANQGVSPYRIMKVMGHDSLDIVLMYCHATDEELIQAIITVPFERMAPASENGGANLTKN